MLTIGVDPHKQTHTAAAFNDLGVEVEHRTAAARPTGNGQLLEWLELDEERVWAVEDVRNVSGSLERFLIDRGETVVRLAPLRWQLHDLWSDFELPAKALTQPGWQTKIANRLADAEQTIQITIARDMIARIAELSDATKDLYDKIAGLVSQVAPQLLAEPGIGVLLAAKFRILTNTRRLAGTRDGLTSFRFDQPEPRSSSQARRCSPAT
jgi:hypothetical protein